jgi:hypothetical protein
VAIGGGGIQTMRTYWERASTNLEGTAQQIKQNVNDDSVAKTVVMPESSTAEPAGVGSSESKSIPPPPPLDL